MTPEQIKTIMKSFTILYDTREHQNEALDARLSSMKCPVERYHLNYGDYSARVIMPDESPLYMDGFVVIERKESLSEIAGNFTTNRERFAKEFERAKAVGAKTYIVVEDATWEKAYAGAYRSKMLPQAMVASMTAWMARYDTKILFCEKRTSGKLIKDVLWRETREMLANMDGEIYVKKENPQSFY